MEINHSYVIDSRKRKETIFLFLFAFLTTLFLTTTIIFGNLYMKISKKNASRKRFLEEVKDDSSNERYIEVISQVTNDSGAYIRRGKYDIPNSKYFKYIDIYNTKSNGSLVLLEKFKTYQQTSEYTCGLASLIMAVNYIDGTVLNETDLAIRVGANDTFGTLIANLAKLVGELGYEYETKTNFTNETLPTRDVEHFAEYIKDAMTEKEPIIILSYDWGGHYNVIIGYDDMGTKDYTEDDVLILADPYDTTDHMNDGYTIFNFERLYSQMLYEVFDVEDQDYNFIRLKRKN